jgi:hypothetical protein
MNKIRFAQLYEWFTLLIFGLFLIFDLTWRGTTMFNTIAYALFAAIGLIGLLTLKKRKPDWRIFDIVFNVLLLLYSAVMLYSIYIK